MKKAILAINPGSTSTKIAVYNGTVLAWQENIEHNAGELAAFPTIYSQLAMRLAVIEKLLDANHVIRTELAAVVGRGGLLPPVSAGAYEVNAEMLDVLENRPVNHHASNLGAALAFKIAAPLGIKAYIYDPVTVDEMASIARITGLKEVMRHGQGHNLNMRAAALRFCKEQKLDYKTVTVIVAHLGGGITLSLHARGKIIDMLSDDDGPFSPERAGLIPAFKLVKITCEGGKDYTCMMKLLQRQGGLVSHLGTSDAREVEARAQSGDAHAALIYSAMALSVARAVANLSVMVDGSVDSIILTGGIAHSALFTDQISKRVSFIAPVHIIPGENEMQALAEGVCRVLTGEETAHIFTEEKP
jgi:butyrate kinase